MFVSDSFKIYVTDKDICHTKAFMQDRCCLICGKIFLLYLHPHTPYGLLWKNIIREHLQVTVVELCSIPCINQYIENNKAELLLLYIQALNNSE